MRRIFDIAFKDWLQLSRDPKTFMFLLIMPVAFTLLFGFAFGGFSSGVPDTRLPVAFNDHDHSRLSQHLHDLFAASQVLRLDETPRAPGDLETLVADGKLAAAIIVPSGYGRAMLANKPARVQLLNDKNTTAGTTIEAEVIALTGRLDSAAHTAVILEQMLGDRAPFAYALEQALSAWNHPPIAIAETTSTAVKEEKQNQQNQSLAHSSPGMMLQFAIAGLLTAAQVIVAERKSRALQRLLTTATNRVHILLGHYLAIGLLIFCQFIALIAFGWLVLRVDYLRAPAPILLVALSSALCIGALGVLIGVLAQTDEQAVVFSLIPMFVLSGVGGAWVPLEVTGETFQALGHLSPVAWAMDGFKNITIRGLGAESVLLPSLALLGYAALFFGIAAWRFWTHEER